MDGRLALFAVALAALTLAACRPPAQASPGREALAQRQHTRAVAEADAYLADAPDGPHAAEAWYVRGRALQDMPAADPAAAARQFAQAKQAFQRGLAAGPSPVLEGYLLASLGNACYFLDQYAEAAAALERAAEALAEDDLRAWALYRLGLCRQRIGRFADADAAFSRVMREHAGSIPAQRSREKLGVRAFAVQVGVFSQAPLADAAHAALLKQGHSVQRDRDTAGRSVLRVGPLPSYADAVRLRGQLETQYPGCMVVP